MRRTTRTTITLALLAAALPAAAGAQQDSTMQRDSTARGRTERSSAGEVSRSRMRRTSANNYGLDRDQLMQLQQAINDRTECDAGTADGVMGPRTRRALSCARRELQVTGNGMDALFTALNLDFGTAGSQPGMGTIQRSGAPGQMQRDSAGMRGNPPVNNGTMRDSTRRDSTQGSRPPR